MMFVLLGVDVFVAQPHFHWHRVQSRARGGCYDC